MNKTKVKDNLFETSDKNWHPSNGDYIKKNSRDDAALLRSRIRKENVLKYLLIFLLVTILFTALYYFSVV